MPDAVTADGGRYYWPLVDGKRHGKGRIEWANGARYEGHFVRGLLSGRGRLRTAAGDVYSGEFRDGMMNGRGGLVTAEGATYVGEFRNDLYHGRGRYRTVEGEDYVGEFRNDRYHRRGRLKTKELQYEGEFRAGQFSGAGEAVYAEGSRYRGHWLRGQFHGKGRFQNAADEIFEGDFRHNEFTGRGSHTTPDGARHEGAFVKWRAHGHGRYVDASGSVYDGRFVDGAATGTFNATFLGGRAMYEGELRAWRPHGQGRLRLPNGDTYEGAFAYGVFEGEGTLTYARARPDGTTFESGAWRHGTLLKPELAREAYINVEKALYSQERLLGKALASLAAREPGRINMYLLSVAGDGSQEVFRREVEFVQQQFNERFATRGRSISLINSRSTAESALMATLTSLRAALGAIAARMDKKEDVLFLFLTSHGSSEHTLVLDQLNMRLRGLEARELGEMLKESGIRSKVVVVSACYSGGLIDSIADDSTLVITAARRDRRSFGCADDNDLTFFGRAFFKEALPGSSSLEDAFEKAAGLVRIWEKAELDASGGDAETELSLPQISSSHAIRGHLRKWWDQFAPR